MAILGSNSIRCNMQQNLCLVCATCIDLIWEHPSCKRNVNTGYWFAPLPMQSLCCTCRPSFKDEAIIANLLKCRWFNIEKTEQWCWNCLPFILLCSACGSLVSSPHLSLMSSLEIFERSTSKIVKWFRNSFLECVNIDDTLSYSQWIHCIIAGSSEGSATWLCDKFSSFFSKYFIII